MHVFWLDRLTKNAEGPQFEPVLIAPTVYVINGQELWSLFPTTSALSAVQFNHFFAEFDTPFGESGQNFLTIFLVLVFRYLRSASYAIPRIWVHSQNISFTDQTVSHA